MHITEATTPGIVIKEIIGQDLPLETQKNVAGVAALALLEKANSNTGFEITLIKIKPGSGIGSGAASSGCRVDINELLGKPFTAQELVAFAMEGEKLASA